MNRGRGRPRVWEVSSSKEQKSMHIEDLGEAFPRQGAKPNLERLVFALSATCDVLMVGWATWHRILSISAGGRAHDGIDSGKKVPRKASGVLFR